MPVPNRDTNIARKKKENPGTRKRSLQPAGDGGSEAISDFEAPKPAPEKV
jgi:hypothetical protein